MRMIARIKWSLKIKHIFSDVPSVRAMRYSALYEKAAEIPNSKE